jgi:T-complex protein 1 subunit gamma
VDINDRSQLLSIIKSCLGTKFINRWSEQACQIALDAVSTVVVDENGRREIDIKRYAKVEKVSCIIHKLFVSMHLQNKFFFNTQVPGGTMEDSCVLRGVMLNKDVTHPKMRRHIVKPRILLLDCNLEYKKGESQVLTKPRCLNLRTLFLNIIC